MAWGEDEAIGPDVASAGLHVTERIGRDAAAQPDLEEALEASRYASHPYSSHPKEWPPLVEVAETRQLPPMLIERYNAAAGEGTALCGIFSDIHRAWATVDNSFFIWRFDKWDGQCQEHNVDEQAICAVGLARAKPGIFIEAIQYLLVLATPVELVLVGVCCSASADGTDPYAELSLKPLPEYMIATDGVTMTCITCTDKGQIFLAGRDGHIYELQYTTGSGWRKRCRKVCLTTGIGSLLSRWVLPNAFKFSTVDPIINMVIDDERNTIYARTEGMKLQLFDLGANGDGPLTKVTEEKNIVDPRDAPYGGRRPNARRSAQSPKPSIVCISPLSAMESKWLHAVAVLSDGKRLFLTTSGGSGSSVGLNSSLQRPTCLKIVATRPSPPLGVGGGLTFGAVSAAGRAHPEDLALKVESAFYSAGALIMSDSSATAMSSLLAVQKDSAAQLSLPSTFGTASRSSRALRETVSALPVEGRMLCASDVLPLPDAAFTMQSLYADVECFTGFRKPSEKASIKLWAKGDLPTQHILPRRRVVVFNTMGLMEVIFNRPVDILRKLFDGNTLRSQIEEFFNRFGAGEAAAMCLMLAAKLLYAEDSLISNAVSEKAAEAFEDPGLVGMPQIDGTTALSNTRTQAGGFSMGQVVQDAEPLFSGAYEGLCLCSSRLLYPIWELPIMVIRGPGGTNEQEDGIVVCRLSAGAMKILESKIRSLETFLRSRRNKRRGLYGYVAGLGDSGSILYKTGPIIGSGVNGRSPYNSQIRDINPTDQSASSKKPRLLYTSAELTAMEVRAMECLRRLLRRSGEALFLLQLICQHNVARLAQTLGNDLRKKLVQPTFHQLVCSEDGDQLAMRLISALMEYYIGPEGRGTVEEISTKLREGCPSYFNESDYKYYLAVECLERASMINNPEERDILAKDAFNLLTKIPDSADLSAICKRFENLRFYEAVVRLPLQKAQALDSNADVINGQIDPKHHDMILLQREQCYEVVMNALRTLKGVGQSGMQGADKSSGLTTAVDPASRSKYIKQIIQLSVQWPDTVFHEHLYRTLIELGLENELLEYGGSDLVSFLQSAGRKHQEEVRAVSSLTTGASKLQDLGAPISTSQTKYLELLARYYVLKGEHIGAARMLLILAERQCSNSEEAPTLEKRYEYLRDAVLQAKSASIAADSSRNPIDSSTVDLLEGKLAVLRFQMQIKQELELMVARVENTPPSSSESPSDPFPRDNILADAETAKAAKDKAKELSLNLKSITQLYNDYAVPFNLWEVCLEMLSFANYSGDADSKIVREIWARLLDQALTRGGVAEACSVVKRVGSKLDPADGACLPLDIICLHLEKAALDRLSSGEELVGDDDVARALLGACKGLPEPVLAVYDQLLSNGAIKPSLNLKLRLLRSVLAILREWGMSVIAQRLGTTSSGASFFFDGTFSLSQTGTANQGARDKIISLANRYLNEVKRLNLAQNQTENVYRGFRELEEKLLSPY